jgi:excisionase family DNA binding protein
MPFSLNVLETRRVAASLPPCSPLTLSPKDAAGYLGVSRAYLYQKLKDGTIPFAKMGRRTLIRRADLDGYAEFLFAKTASEQS